MTLFCLHDLLLGVDGAFWITIAKPDGDGRSSAPWTALQRRNIVRPIINFRKLILNIFYDVILIYKQIILIINLGLHWKKATFTCLYFFLCIMFFYGSTKMLHVKKVSFYGAIYKSRLANVCWCICKLRNHSVSLFKTWHTQFWPLSSLYLSISLHKPHWRYYIRTKTNYDFIMSVLFLVLLNLSFLINHLKVIQCNPIVMMKVLLDTLYHRF